MTKYKLVILDRDGVINHDSDAYIKSPSEWRAIAGSLEAIAKLNRAGIKVVVASNQSGIARGLFSAETLERIHNKMQKELAHVDGHLDAIYFCPHHPDDNCNCRKPNIGMLEKILKQYKYNANETLFIGDSLKDLQAAQKIGCDFILVTTGKGASTLQKNQQQFSNIAIFPDLEHAIATLLAK